MLEVGPYDRPLGFAFARLDTGVTARLWHYRLRKAQITPEHGIVPSLASKHVTVARANDGEFDVQTFREKPLFAFQVKQSELSALTEKIRTGQPLSPEESRFVEGVTRLPQNGECSDQVTWQRLNSEITRALAERQQLTAEKSAAAPR